MAKKQQEFSIDDFLRNNLQTKVREEIGKRIIEKTEMPEYFSTTLNPLMQLRPYQREAFQYFINYWENELAFKPYRPHVLFHMATGSGKTLIMAGMIVYLYKQGYRNFLFFVANGNVVGKTEDNFFNQASAKYLFGQTLTIDGKRVEVRKVDNFQGADDNCINFCLTTTQGLHSDLNTPKEGGVSYNDFCTKGLVMISDEAHHMNSAAKKGNDLQVALYDEDDFEPSEDWETTVMRIFNRNTDDGMPNVLLEFTATEDFTDPNIAYKYKDKVLYDYPLKKFREDGYSKDIAVVQSDALPLDRAIQAMILSQYRRKLFTAIQQNVKPVVMFKSKTIAANKAFHDEFVKAVRDLTVEDLKRISSNAKDDVLDAFTYIEENGISYENLLLELREDFKEENMLLVDGNNITPDKQAYLNSLEDKDNEFRAVFAVDMLNEGWDVLNLYDIVRLYDTRDSKGKIPGKTTNAEAQLIGRGARYMPFVAPKVMTSAECPSKREEAKSENVAMAESKRPQIEADMSAPVGSRKYDNDLSNRLRVLETLHYHTTHNPKYIHELNTALTQSGIIPPKTKEVTEKLKDSFKATRLYTEGYVFVNEQEPYLLNEDMKNIGDNILNHKFLVRIKSGDMAQSLAFSKTSGQETASLENREVRLGSFGKHILRAAINRMPEYTYKSLHDYYPNLNSIKEFIESDNYLAKIVVVLTGRKEVITNLSQREKLYAVLEVLKQINPMLSKGGIGQRGTKKFRPRMIKDVFKDHKFKVSEGQNKEEGKSIKDTMNMLLRCDIDSCEWFAYDDNFGTEEEKFLIKYIEEKIDKLREKYDEVYLLRNQKDLKIYAFTDGRATEPDFVLFLRRRKVEDRFDNIQIFIEPKGAHLRSTDKWKEDFEKAIHQEAVVEFNTGNFDFDVWGMPFFTHEQDAEFREAMKENFGIN